MSVKILMPALSPTMTKGVLANWLVSEGDNVEAGQVIAEIETDKATMEVEVVDDGIIAKIVVAAGTKDVLVNSVIALLAEENEDISEVSKEFIASIDASTEEVSNEKKDSLIKDKAINKQDKKAIVKDSGVSDKRIFISPLAKFIAKNNNLDVSRVVGSGPKGRIIKADIENVLNNSFISKDKPSRSTPFEPSYDKLPVNTMREVIANRLTESKNSVPHFYLSCDVEIDSLLSARKYLNNCSDGNYKISVNDIVLKAVAVSLKKVPDANVSWNDTFIKQYKSVDISVAVAIEGGLITPIIRDADYKSLVDISKEMKELVIKAKAGRLVPEEYQGGTVSVSNLGMFGVKQFSAIINSPQSSILAVGAGEPRAVVKNGELMVANVMNLTLSVDHRAVNGDIGAKFLATIKESLEQPISLMMDDK